MSRQFKKRDKKFNKMTRDGLIEQNAVTKEEENISGREQALDLRNKPCVANIQDVNIQSKGHGERHGERRENPIYAPRPDKRPDKKKRRMRHNLQERQMARSVERANNSTIRSFETFAQINTVISDKIAETVTLAEQPKQEEYGQSSGTSAEEQEKEHTSCTESNKDIPLNTKPPPKPLGTERPGRLKFVKDAIKTTKPDKRRNRSADKQYRQKQPTEPGKERVHPPEGGNGDIALNTKPPPNAIETELPGRLEFIKNTDRNIKPKNLRNRKNSTQYQRKFTAKAQNQEKIQFPNMEQANKADISVNDNKPAASGKIELEKPSSLITVEAEKSPNPEKPDAENPSDFGNTRLEKPRNTEVSQPDTAKPYTAKMLSREQSKLRKKSDKLRFTNDEQPPRYSNKAQDSTVLGDKKLEKLKDKAEKYNIKLEKARNKLPSEKTAKVVRSFDERTGKVKRRLMFKTETLPQGAKKPVLSERIAFAGKGVESVGRVGANKLHQKVYEVEDENAGVKAGHRTEQAAESVYRFGKRFTHSSFRHSHNRQYRTVEKLEQKAVKSESKYNRRKAVSDNPQLQSNAISRYMQKRRMKRQYAEAAREAKRTGETVNTAANFTARAAKAVAGIIRSHPMATGAVVLALLFIFTLYSLFSSFMSMSGGAFTAIAASSYIAVDYEIDNAELYYSEWETDLLIRINEIKGEKPGYDEYRIKVNNVGHNPYELAAFLTVMYQDFKYEDIESVLQEIFDKQHRLTVSEQVETRYRTVIKTDPATGEEYEDTEACDWYVLNVSVVSRSFTDVIMPYLNVEQRELYSVLMQTKGNRQYIDNPFDFNWLSRVSDYYGYRVHPITGAKNYHKGVDIAVPIGTEIHAGHDGVVTFADYSGGYGYVAVIENGKGLVSKYAHCDSLLVSDGQEVKSGDIIAISGNSGDSTGPHLHLEVIKDGHYLNPLYFAVTNDDGTYSAPVFGYPGEKMQTGATPRLLKKQRSI